LLSATAVAFVVDVASYVASRGKKFAVRRAREYSRRRGPLRRALR
jgi:hypothetical protein